MSDDELTLDEIVESAFKTMCTNHVSNVHFGALIVAAAIFDLRSAVDHLANVIAVANDVAPLRKE